ncbi:YbaB/EbfC family nucleoid-associated protein [Micromonospora echinofusca]|uniref:YbaB/EbfC family nucleoid-associated protein n=1 Tax=Micromonospora echinofusca TaxID=47858 RepID=UPI002021CEAD|nr:YbaB/EbfC family nucleoid-associated protein [Micromonospora sp. MSM11]MCL7456261.1 YbaB/EbfC family DNA-binding protein [Micromonospora sp. MSM11]
MWADEAALDEATRRLDAWEASIADRAARAKDLASQVQAMRGTATSPDRTIQVTVDSSGLLVDLRLDERTRQHSAAHTARQILETTRAAHADLLSRITEATRGILGAEDPTAAALVESYRRRLGPDRGAPDARR